MTSTAISAQGSTFAINTGTTQAPVWSEIANVKTFSGFDGSAAEIDVTNLKSDAKEYHIGLIDNGQFTLEIDQDNSDTGQAALRTARTAATLSQFKLTLPNNDTATFGGYVKKFNSTGGVDQVVKSSVDIRITGAVTWA